MHQVVFVFAAMVLVASIFSQAQAFPFYNRPMVTFDKRPSPLNKVPAKLEPLKQEAAHLEEKLFLAQRLYDDILDDINDILLEEKDLGHEDPAMMAAMAPPNQRTMNKARRHELWNYLTDVNTKFSRN